MADFLEEQSPLAPFSAKQSLNNQRKDQVAFSEALQLHLHLEVFLVKNLLKELPFSVGQSPKNQAQAYLGHHKQMDLSQEVLNQRAASSLGKRHLLVVYSRRQPTLLVDFSLSQRLQEGDCLGQRRSKEAYFRIPIVSLETLRETFSKRTSKKILQPMRTAMPSTSLKTNHQQ
jgi:hypothetical protein